MNLDLAHVCLSGRDQRERPLAPSSTKSLFRPSIYAPPSFRMVLVVLAAVCVVVAVIVSWSWLDLCLLIVVARAGDALVSRIVNF